MTDRHTDVATDLRWRDAVAPAALGWIVARVVLSIGFWLTHRLVDVMPPPRGNRPYELGLYVWDGTFYRMLAEGWYSTARPDAARFFPLFPALARLLAPVLGGREDLALLVISNAAAVAAAMVVWRLAAEVTGDRGVANRSAWMVSLFPTAFVLAFAYTESLALLLTAATLLALHRRAWAITGALAFAAALLRPVGGLVLVAILVELYRVRPRPSWATAAAVVGPVAGLGAALVWIWRSTDDLLLPVSEQGKIRGGFQDPFTRVLEPIGELLKGDTRDVYNLVFMWLLIVLLVLAVRLRQPPSWIAYAGASLVVLYSSQVTDSVGRYGLVVVPFVVAIAQWARHRWQQAAVAGVGCAGLVWLSAQAWLGHVVP